MGGDVGHLGVRPPRFDVVSLFSGCGGLDLGFVEAGGRIVYACDRSKHAVACYRHNLGDHCHQRDVTGPAFWSDVEQIDRTDVVLGGFPCQGFSKAGPKRRDDDRNQLYRSMQQTVLRLRPRVFVAENVDGIQQNFKGTFVDRVREGFWLSVIVGSAIMALGAVGVWTLGRPVVGLFGAGAGAEELAMDYLKVVSVGWPLFGLLFGLQNLLQGLKRPLAPLLVGTWRQGFAMAVFGWLFVQVLAWGPHGVWAAVLAGMITGTLMMVAATAWVLRGEDLRLVG